MNFEKLLTALKQEIFNQNYGENPPELYEPIRYIMALGGKRLRFTGEQSYKRYCCRIKHPL